MSKRKTQKLKLEKTVNGIKYSGYSIIEGTRTFHQTIYLTRFGSRYDSRGYKIGEDQLMEHFATTIFSELVNEQIKNELS